MCMFLRAHVSHCVHVNEHCVHVNEHCMHVNEHCVHVNEPLCAHSEHCMCVCVNVCYAYVYMVNESLCSPMLCVHTPVYLV